MTHLVLVVLSCSNQIGSEVHVFGQFYLDFTTASSTGIVLVHVVIEFGNRIVISPSTNIKHHAILRLDVLADSLEEPFMTVDFTVISLLYCENKVNSAAFKLILLEAEVLGANLEQMQDVFGDLILWDIGVH